MADKTSKRLSVPRHLNWPLAKRLHFHSKPGPDGCRLWTGCTSDGYGSAWWNGRMHEAHRLGWEEKNGPIPVGMHVLHKCDVRRCINPEHLFLGKNADNIADKVAKNRQRAAQGEANRHAVLTEEDVRAIRASSASQKWLARAYGVSVTHMSNIRTRKKWAHID